MFGLKDLHISKIRAILANYPAIEKAILYGSRAKGDFRENSDIDLSLLGTDINLSTLHRIENELDDLLLPYQIDLSIFDKIENKNLVEHINRVGVLFYSKQTLP